jgi:hypothetical protein
MDLLFIARKIWRYKLVTLPIVALMIAGSWYVLFVKEPLYEAQSSYLLVNPPSPPTAEQIARNPALGRIDSDNPYTRYPDQAVVIDVLTRSLNSQSARKALVKAGADERYIVGSGAQFGSASPIVQISGTGSTPAIAMRTAEVVGHAVVGELDRMQDVEKVDPGYRITTLQVEVPENAQLRASGQLRMLVAVLALGTIMLFVVVSFFDALATLISQRRGPLPEPVWGPEDLALLDPDQDLEAPARSNGHWHPSPSNPTFERPA